MLSVFQYLAPTAASSPKVKLHPATVLKNIRRDPLFFFCGGGEGGGSGGGEVPIDHKLNVSSTPEVAVLSLC